MHAKLILIGLLLKCVSSARILALMVVPAHSHHFWNGRYLQALASRGHDITYFSVDKFPSPPKNIRQIFVDGAYGIYDSIDFSETSDMGPYRSIYALFKWTEEGSVMVSQSQGFRELLEVLRTEKFDLVVVDFSEGWFLLGGVDLVGRPPVVAVTPFGIPSYVLSVLGNPFSCSSKPYFLSQYTNEMSFLQRADNCLLHLWTLALEWFFLRKENELARSSFGANVRPLEEIMEDINIVLVNSNHATDYPFPKVAGLIPVGGLHIEKPKALPQHLKTFLDEARHGLVYFSLGSNIKSSAVAAKDVAVLCEAFRKLSPVRVLWKWDAGSVPDQPSNVRVSKWVPQNDVLGHPNVRVFFTHGGLLSTQEAMYHGKAIVGLGFFLDQDVNLNKLVERGLGEKLTLGSLTVDNVVATINKVLNEPRYSENAKNASILFKDDMDNPLERAVFWTEYAIRHKGAPHLRHSSRNLSWHQNWMLDVIVVGVGVVSLVCWGACKLVVVVLTSAGSRRTRRKKADGEKKE